MMPSPRHRLRWALHAGLLASACRPEPVVAPPPVTPVAETPAAPPLDPIVAMDFESGRSCAVHASGLVTCRGDGRPVHTLPGITDAVGVVIHYQEVCAWTRSGAVRCKPYADDIPPAAAPFPDGVMQMAAAGERCALLRTGDVYCDVPARNSPLTPEHDAVELAVGSRVHCVRHRSGAVSCARRDEQDPEVVLKLPDPTQARQLTLVGHDLCILQSDESTRCWKLSREGPFTATDQQLPPLPPFTALVAGDRFRCGLSRAGGVNCWGNNYSGQLGAISDLGSPVETVHGIDDAQSLFAGLDSTCARRRDGSTWCWGDNQGGQLDDGQPVSVRLPGQPWHLPGLRALALARDRTCAVLADGEITCWGTRAAWTRPRPTNAPGPADALALGDYYDCALLRSGQVACRTTQRSRHEQIPDPSRGWWVLPDRGPIASLLTLFNTVVSLHRDGSLKLWDPLHAPVADRPGFLGATQLCASNGAYFIRQGDGRVRCSGEECFEVHSLADIAAIATTWDSFCALGRDGSLRCANDRNRKAMFAVPGRYSAISGSLANLCALAEDRRSVYCWGHSLLGRPTRPYIDTPLGPATVAALPAPAQSIVVGETHVCATFSGERLTCWGANDWGQLGNGKSGARILPAPYPQP